MKNMKYNMYSESNENDWSYYEVYSINEEMLLMKIVLILLYEENNICVIWNEGY